MLYISVRTAETHRAHIMQKLRLSTRAELVRYALQQGLLDDWTRDGLASPARAGLPNGRSAGFTDGRAVRFVDTCTHGELCGSVERARLRRPGREARAGAERAPVRGGRGRSRIPFIHRIFYEDIESVHVGRESPERLAGRPSLVVERAVGGPLRIGSVSGLGILSELAELLGRLTATRLAYEPRRGCRPAAIGLGRGRARPDREGAAVRPRRPAARGALPSTSPTPRRCSSSRGRRRARWSSRSSARPTSGRPRPSGGPVSTASRGWPIPSSRGRAGQAPLHAPAF